MSPSEDLAAQFDEQSRALLRYLRNDVRYDRSFIPRPFFLEFTGSPSSGKSTTITELDKFFRRQGFRVLRPQEGAEVIRHIDRTTPLYNIRTGQYALNLLVDLSVGTLYDIVIFDRCLFDVYGWMEYWYGKGRLSEEEKKLIQDFFLSRFFTDKLDLVYFMVADPAVAMARELRVSLTQKLGETTNPQTIQTLVKRYQEVYQLLASKYPQLRLVDTTHLTEQAMVETIAKDVLETLALKIKNAP